MQNSADVHLFFSFQFGENCDLVEECFSDLALELALSLSLTHSLSLAILSFRAAFLEN